MLVKEVMTRNVITFREDTPVDEIASILEAKREVFNSLIAQADKPESRGLTEDEIFGLFDIKARPKRDKHS